MSLCLPEHGLHEGLVNYIFFNFIPFCYLYFLNRMCVLFKNDVTSSYMVVIIRRT